MKILIKFYDLHYQFTLIINSTGLYCKIYHSWTIKVNEITFYAFVKEKYTICFKWYRVYDAFYVLFQNYTQVCIIFQLTSVSIPINRCKLQFFQATRHVCPQILLLRSRDTVAKVFHLSENNVARFIRSMRKMLVAWKLIITTNERGRIQCVIVTRNRECQLWNGISLSIVKVRNVFGRSHWEYSIFSTFQRGWNERKWRVVCI